MWLKLSCFSYSLRMIESCFSSCPPISHWCSVGHWRSHTCCAHPGVHQLCPSLCYFVTVFLNIQHSCIRWGISSLSHNVALEQDFSIVILGNNTLFKGNSYLSNLINKRHAFLPHWLLRMKNVLDQDFKPLRTVGHLEKSPCFVEKQEPKKTHLICPAWKTSLWTRALESLLCENLLSDF